VKGRKRTAAEKQGAQKRILAHLSSRKQKTRRLLIAKKKKGRPGGERQKSKASRVTAWRGGNVKKLEEKKGRSGKAADKNTGHGTYMSFYYSVQKRKATKKKKSTDVTIGGGSCGNWGEGTGHGE